MWVPRQGEALAWPTSLTIALLRLSAQFTKASFGFDFEIFWGGEFFCYHIALK